MFIIAYKSKMNRHSLVFVTTFYIWLFFGTLPSLIASSSTLNYNLYSERPHRHEENTEFILRHNNLRKGKVNRQLLCDNQSHQKIKENDLNSFTRDYDFLWDDKIIKKRNKRHRHHHHNHQHHTGSKKSFRSVSDMFLENEDNLTPPHWPVKKEAIVEGDVLLGALMMVHSREDTMTCGPIMPQGGIQSLEAMLFTLDKINKGGLIRNVTIGALALDDCDKDTYGLEMAVDFIKGEIFFFLFSFQNC